MRYRVFYHIYVGAGAACLAIVDEQLQTLLSSRIFDSIESVECCVTGNDRENYDNVLQRLAALGGKFKINIAAFDDKTHERFTLTRLMAQAEPDTAYLYMHTKGMTRPESLPVREWRHCLEHFLINQAHQYVDLLQSNDTLGIFRLQKKYRIDGVGMVTDHYSGNFWWARGDYLQRLAKQQPTIGGEYLAPEMYVLSASDPPPRVVNLFPKSASYKDYASRLPESEYVDHVYRPLCTDFNLVYTIVAVLLLLAILFIVILANRLAGGRTKRCKDWRRKNSIALLQ